VSFNQQTTTLLESLRRSTLDLLTQQNRLATGRAFGAPSEDPAAATQVLQFENVTGRQDQILENLQHAGSVLDVTDAAISEVHGLLSDAHAIASQNVGALASAEEREAAAELIADIVDQLVTIGNRQFNGSFLFAGRDTQNAPFQSILGGVAYTGDTGDILARVALLEEEPVNLSGDALFGALSAGVAGAVDLSPRLTADTRLEDVARAEGLPLQLGSLVIARDGDPPITIDLTTADSLGDLVDLINDAAGGLVNASLGDDSITLTPVGGPVTVREVSGGRVAADLGLLTPDPTADPIESTSLRRRLTRTTAVADLAGGAGLDLTGGLTVTNGGTTATIDLSAAETVQDILNAINNAGLYVTARINQSGTGIDVINQVSGANLSIAEDGGTTASQLGLRTLDLDTRLADLNFGRGIETVQGQDDLRITAKDGATVDVNLDDAATIGDVIDAINAAADEAGVGISASLSATGNGIRVVDGTGGDGRLSIGRLNLSYALDDLGLSGAVEDPQTELIGDDVNTTRTDGVLTALIDLERALRADDTRGITDAASRVNGFINEVNRVRGVVGARAQAMQSRRQQTENAVLATQQLVSELRDLDYTEAVTRFQQAQTALQAALLTGGQSLNLSLMNFLE